jgi:hypothetical protein
MEGDKEAEGLVKVRLWAPIGAPGSAIASMQRKCLLYAIAGPPGVEVLTPFGPGKVQAAGKNRCVVKLFSGGTAYMTDRVMEDVSCPIARVMPLVEAVAEKNRAASQRAKSHMLSLPISLEASGNELVAKLEQRREDLRSNRSLCGGGADNGSSDAEKGEKLLEQGEILLKEVLTGQSGDAARAEALERLARVACSLESYSELSGLAEELRKNAGELVACWVPQFENLQQTKAVSALLLGGAELGVKLDSIVQEFNADEEIVEATRGLATNFAAGSTALERKASELGLKLKMRAMGRLPEAVASLEGTPERLHEALQMLKADGVISATDSLLRLTERLILKWVQVSRPTASAADLVEEFESGDLADQVSKLMTWLSLDDVDGPTGKLAQYLNSQDGEGLAGQLVAEGTKHLESLRSLRDSKAVRGLLSRLGDPSLRDAIVSGIGGVDADQLLDMGESLVRGDESERIRMLQTLQDSVLDFLLQCLPSLEVPPITSVSRQGLNSTIINLNLSDFRLRPEDVRLSVVGVRSGQAGSSDRGDSFSDEVFSVVAENICASFKGISWACRQDTFPFGTAAGTADATVVQGRVSLKFSLKRSSRGGGNRALIVVSGKSIHMESLGLRVGGSRAAFLINALASAFKTTIRDYVCASLLDTLEQNAAALLGPLNGLAANSMPMLLSFAGVALTDLPIATKDEEELAGGHEVVHMDAAAGLAAFSAADGLPGLTAEDLPVYFVEDGSLGLQVDIFSEAPDHPIVVVAHVREGAQAARNLDDSTLTRLRGSKIIACDGKSLGDHDAESIISALQTPIRPLCVTFRRYVPVTSYLGPLLTPGDVEGSCEVRFVDENLGLRLCPSPTLGPTVVEVLGFADVEDGKPGPAELSGVLIPGQVLHSINGDVVLGIPFDSVVQLLRRQSRPTTFCFLPPPECQVRLESPPVDLVLGYVQQRIAVVDFRKIESIATSRVGLQVGDVLDEINGIKLPTSAGLEGDASLVTYPTIFPVRLRFTRPMKRVGGDLGPSSPKKLIIDVRSLEEMPVVLDAGTQELPRPVVKAFKTVPGPGKLSGLITKGTVIRGIGGKRIPPCVTKPEDVQRALAGISYPTTLSVANMKSKWAIKQHLLLASESSR